ncbi:MAG: DNA-3-methyladenine glycosylase [Candidatus Dojkabacteria bacterium]|nr:DNA-3-methyladenine glycosylase [Candidatus Dojkabacteria bacterium]MDQ7020353.1 DNA-3-methyladenine glycosylase [Candidatus Dojkabacteria bacterium]
MIILENTFFNRDATLVAKDLLGKLLVRKLGERIISGVIVETEAYLGANDPAAHSFIGKTERTKVLFGPAGYAYIHSMHGQNLLDITCSEINDPVSVLIRALEPIEVIDLMQKFRSKEKLKDLTTGPGKLCKAMDIDKSFYGLDLTNKDSTLFIVENDSEYEVMESERIGISKGKEHILRFFIKRNKFVS